jgi:tRNA(Ile)-lysidine synthase
VALSGGADSVALAWIVAELADAGRCRSAGLIHVHHGLRGADADADEAFCRRLAAELGCPIDVVRVDVRARVGRTRESLEAAARALRYDAFAAAARRLGASLVATAHTADDQAETVLLRLLRGAGARGLGGIRQRRGPYVRPLLGVRRADLVCYLERRGATFRDDASNRDVSIPRNRLRHELMPVVERLAPGAVAALARTAALAGDDEAYLERRALRAMARASRDGGLDAAAVRQLPRALARRVIREAAGRAAPRGPLSAAHVEAVRALAASRRPSARVDLPGLTATREGGSIVFRAPRDPVAARPFRHTLSVPGQIVIDETGVAVSASVRSAVAPAELTAGGASLAMVQAGSFEPPLVVRSRLPGDRIRPLGAPGQRKVQDLLVDRKVPRADRDRVPIVVDAVGQVVWVAGVAIADACRVTAPEGGVVILKVTERFQR